MNRIQNAVLVVWVVILLLFAAFNWQMVWRPVTVVFLFQEFDLPILLWLVLGAIATSATLRALSELEVRIRHRQADKEINVIKARAFDGLTGEFDKLVTNLQSQLGDRIQSMLGDKAGKEGAAEDAPPEAKGKDDDDTPPKLSEETAATLAELKSGSPGNEDEAEKKPKRRWRKKKAGAADAENKT